VFLSLKAFGVGVLVESVGFYAWFVALIMADVLSHYLSKDAEAFASRLRADPRFLAGLVLVQVAFMFLGGLVAGHIAKRKWVAHGLAVGTAGVIVVWLNYPELPWWGLVEMSLALPAAICGAIGARATVSRGSAAV
jgi:hypothetical protein